MGAEGARSARQLKRQGRPTASLFFFRLCSFIAYCLTIINWSAYFLTIEIEEPFANCIVLFQMYIGLPLSSNSTIALIKKKKKGLPRLADNNECNRCVILINSKT